MREQIFARPKGINTTLVDDAEPLLDSHVHEIMSMVLMSAGLGVEPISRTAIFFIEFLVYGQWQKAALLLRRAGDVGLNVEEIIDKMLELGIAHDLLQIILSNNPMDLPNSPAHFRHAKATRSIRFSQ